MKHPRSQLTMGLAEGRFQAQPEGPGRGMLPVLRRARSDLHTDSYMSTVMRVFKFLPLPIKCKMNRCIIRVLGLKSLFSPVAGLLNCQWKHLPRRTVVKNAACSAGHSDLSPGPGRSHTQRGKEPRHSSPARQEALQ